MRVGSELARVRQTQQRRHLAFSGALNRALASRTRARIALADLGPPLATLDKAEIAANRKGHSKHPRAYAAMAFARRLAEGGSARAA